ncbi:MAG: putative O-glycosylation ligase, exosortase system-associated [Sphingomonas bacterium]|nr:putative O-glycosylation ligase, exosortase system-associated [Sphingomonas bacterium]
MHDLALVGFLIALGGIGLRRPFLFVLGYVYVDIVSPQRLSYYLLNSIPISLIFFVLAVGGWAFVDDKKGLRVSIRQVMLVILLAYCGYTTWTADFPAAAFTKWDWVWKSLLFAIFLPFTLRNRLRIEALLLFMTLSISTIVIVGGIKTLFSGGGYGMLNLIIDDNTGLYEGSIISTAAIAIVPLILYLVRYGTIFPPEWKSRVFAGALIFACLLIPIGTQARTGLICIGVLALTTLRDVKRRFLYLAGMGVALAIAVPLLPASYTERMNTIQGYHADTSASTRIAVWKWTWAYVQDHPGGGGFNAYLQNHLTIDLSATGNAAGGSATTNAVEYDKARAYHSSYFEMLGEQGYFGFGLWALFHLIGLIRMEMLRRRFRKATDPGEAWIAPLASALQHGQLIALAGSLFVGIAFQSFIYMIIAAEIGLDGIVTRTRPKAVPRPMGAPARPIEA